MPKTKTITVEVEIKGVPADLEFKKRARIDLLDEGDHYVGVDGFYGRAGEKRSDARLILTPKQTYAQRVIDWWNQVPWLSRPKWVATDDDGKVYFYEGDITRTLCGRGWTTKVGLRFIAFDELASLVDLPPFPETGDSHRSNVRNPFWRGQQ